MAPPFKSSGGGYSEETVRKLKSARLPEKLKCATCNKYRRQEAFSNSQLNRVRNAIALKGPEYVESGRAIARCRDCIGDTTVELTCMVCGKTKAINEFAKNQRHDPDRARCSNCVQDHLEAEPWDDNYGIEDTGSSGHYESNAIRSIGEAGFDEDFDTTSHGTSRTISARGYGDEDDDDDDSVGGGVWVDPSRGDETSETGKAKSHVFTAFDAQGSGHQRMTSEGGDAESVVTGWKSCSIDASNTDNDPVPRRQRGLRKKRSGRWAKVEGPRFPKGTAPSMRIPESGRYLVASDEEDDDKVHDISDYL